MRKRIVALTAALVGYPLPSSAQRVIEPGLYTEYQTDNYGIDKFTGAYIYGTEVAATGPNNSPENLSMTMTYSSSAFGGAFYHSFDALLSLCYTHTCVSNHQGFHGSLRVGSSSIRLTSKIWGRGVRIVYSSDAKTATAYLSSGIIIELIQVSCGSAIACYLPTMQIWPNGDRIIFKRATGGLLQQVNNSRGDVILFYQHAQYTSKLGRVVFFNTANTGACLENNSTICSVPADSRQTSFSYAAMAYPSVTSPEIVMTRIDRHDGTSEEFRYVLTPQQKIALESHNIVGHSPKFYNTYVSGVNAAYQPGPRDYGSVVTSQIFSERGDRYISVSPLSLAMVNPRSKITYTEEAGQVRIDEMTLDKIMHRTDENGNVRKVTYTDGYGSFPSYYLTEFRGSPAIIKEELPSGRSINYTYDARGNILTVSETPPSGSGLPARTLQRVYLEAESIVQCANYYTCNKPSYEIDYNNNRTDFSWDAKGLPLLVKGPPDGDGVRPERRYTYQTKTAPDGNLITLLDEMKVKINASSWIISKYRYDARLRLSAEIRDTGASQEITCYSYDGWNNTISKTYPKGAAACDQF